MLIKKDKLSMARSFAVLPTTYVAEPDSKYPAGYFRCSVQTIWFRRTKGVLRIHYGTTHDYLKADTPPTFEEFCERYSMARYGPDVEAIWSGTVLWVAPRWGAPPDTEDRRQKLIADLAPLLEDFDQSRSVPAGWIGWFEATDERQG